MVSFKNHVHLLMSLPSGWMVAALPLPLSLSLLGHLLSLSLWFTYLENIELNFDPCMLQEPHLSFRLFLLPTKSEFILFPTGTGLIYSIFLGLLFPTAHFTGIYTYYKYMCVCVCVVERCALVVFKHFFPVSAVFFLNLGFLWFCWLQKAESFLANLDWRENWFWVGISVSVFS